MSSPVPCVNKFWNIVPNIWEMFSKNLKFSLNFNFIFLCFPGNPSNNYKYNQDCYPLLAQGRLSGLKPAWLALRFVFSTTLHNQGFSALILLISIKILAKNKLTFGRWLTENLLNLLNTWKSAAGPCWPLDLARHVYVIVNTLSGLLTMFRL